MNRALASLVVVAGCNQVYGLDGTRVIDETFADKDGDGIADADDNCVDVANAFQTDGDRDGLGDACDGCEACAPCPGGANHDEDDDKLDDVCDPCPMDRLPMEDADGDGLGDACDRDTNARFLFDGFATISDDWLEVGARWTADGDRARPDPDVPTSPYRLQHARPGPSGSSWYIELAMTPPAERGNNIGLEPVTELGLTYECSVQLLVDGYYLYMAGNVVGPLDLEPSELIVLRMTVTGATSPQTARCEIAGVSEVATNDVSIDYPIFVRFRGERADHAFAYVFAAH
jgi:hypothetical protein